jgi:K+/H+ antiporter YhaU regulatory subunit KhtT
MASIKSLQRALTISLDGLREALFAIAERVAARVQVGKLQFLAEDSESRLRSAYETLGYCLYRIRSVPQPPTYPDGEILLHFDRIRAEYQALQGIQDRLATQYDEILGGPLLQLRKDLKDAGGGIERVTIGPTSHADGKLLGDMPFPESVRIVAIRRGETIFFPSAGFTLAVGDHVTLIGTRSAIPEALQLLRA